MVRRIEPELTEKYRKDPQIESFLEKFNRILAPWQEEEYIPDLPETYPTLHVIGVPRSGTTLVTQLLAAHTDIGYINNLIAAFWQAPVYGIRLSSLVVPRTLRSSYQSDYGRTRGIHEPHEFGYFWSSLLNYREMRERAEGEPENIDWKRVRLVLMNMAHTFEHPIVFKSFLLGWHIQSMQAVLPKTCWIHIRRDPVSNILSMLKLRQEMLGSIEKWVSLKPKEYAWLKDKPHLEQVVAKYFFLEKRYQSGLKRIPPEQVIHLSYEKLCTHPNGVLDEIQEMLSRLDASLQIITPAPKFTMSTIDDTASTEEIEMLLDRYQNTYGPIQ